MVCNTVASERCIEANPLSESGKAVFVWQLVFFRVRNTSVDDPFDTYE